MKVTAIIADDLIYEVKEHTHCSTVTEAITVALKDWIDLYNIKELIRPKFELFKALDQEKGQAALMDKNTKKAAPFY